MGHLQGLRPDQGPTELRNVAVHTVQPVSDMAAPLPVCLRAASWASRSHYCKTFPFVQQTFRDTIVNAGKEATFAM